MRIGIVGARDYPNLDKVAEFVAALEDGTVVVSGGAKGVDSAAAKSARLRGLEVIEHLPDLSGCKSKGDFTPRYHQRNQKIADDIDILYAFTHKDYGGTWDTIRRAKARGIPVTIFRD